MKNILALLGLLLLTAICKADEQSIKTFELRQNPFADNEVVVVATDSVGTILEGIGGGHTFYINGFKERLSFENGTGFYSRKLEKSTFIYLKNQDEYGFKGSVLYYVLKFDTHLFPIKISWLVFIIIPILLILLGYMFRKLIWLAVVLFIAFSYFHLSSGLGFATLFETITAGLKSLL